MNESQIFIDALKLTDPAERAAYLDAACPGNPEARAGVEALLRVHASNPDFLEHPTDPLTAAVPPGIERAGAVLAGRYKLLEQVGEGGMGAVWMAQQTEPVRRLVAIKVIKAGMDSKQVITRFEAERQALAVMDHPNIAKVLDGGTTDSGRPYFVMELVKGMPITKYCDEHQLTPRQRLELFVSVCQAIQHAHQKGIIHRDLKPSNVLVAPYDGVPVPKVIDFGVAKAAGQVLTERTLVTGFGAIVGTLEYMSPEQAELNNHDIDTRSDIYSLGVLLYELLTGSTPFSRKELEKAGMLEMLRVIREQEPTKPSTKLSTAEGLPTLAANRGTEPARLTRLVRGELDWVVMRALEKDRNRRYETPNGFALDLQRYLADEPVLACPPSAWYRLRKFARRNRALFVTASVVGLAVLVALATLAVSTVLIAHARDHLQKTLERERRDANYHRTSLAHRELSADNLGRALRLLDACPEDLRGWEWRYLMRLCRVEPLVIPDTTEVNGVAFSPDGERLASACGDGTVKIRNSRTGTVIQAFKVHSDSAVSVAFHPNGRHVASAGADRTVKVWDLTTEKEVFSGPCAAIRRFGTAYTVAFSPPDGRKLAAGSDGKVRVWDWKSRQLLHTFAGHENDSIAVAFSHDGRHLVTGGASGEGQKLWDVEVGGPPLRTFPAHRNPVSVLAFSPDGKWVASASFDRTVNLSDSTTGGLVRTLDLHTGNVEGVAFSVDGRCLASAGEDRTVRVWDVTTGREVLALLGHTDRCGCVAFSPDGKRLASASSDGTIRLWDATPLEGDEGRQETLTFAQHSDEVRSVAFSPDGRWIVSAGQGPLVKVWDAQTGRVRAEFSGHTTIAFCVAWHGQRIATAGADGPLRTVKVWDAQTGDLVFQLPAGQEQSAVPYFAAAFSPNGLYLVTGNANGAVQVWDAKTGREVGTLGTHKREIRGVAFSRDGRHLASASGDGEVKLWDATCLGEKQEARHTLRARVPGPSLNVAFSPDGQRLATGGEENTVKVWDVRTGRELRTLRGHRGEVCALAFSPDEGRWVASGGEDSTVKVWDSHTGKLVRSFRGHTGLVSSLAFSPDGRHLVSGSRDSTVKVWDLPLSSEVPGR